VGRVDASGIRKIFDLARMLKDPIDLSIGQPDFDVAPQVVLVTQHDALACPQVDLTAPIAAYRAKRDLMVGILRQYFTLSSPDGAFYLWAQAPAGLTGYLVVERAIANHGLIIPGSVFSARASHFRICYTVPVERLRQGAEMLCRLASGG